MQSCQDVHGGVLPQVPRDTSCSAVNHINSNEPGTSSEIIKEAPLLPTATLVSP